ncbi:MAG: FAA hydrolase family protein [Rhodospirillales bacterium]|nr:FAA hydrolase family protein [Rhodospirillales bacterium]MSP81105.1 FAA hydrolase family protein [Rhodospirillales bacterium]
MIQNRRNFMKTTALAGAAAAASTVLGQSTTVAARGHASDTSGTQPMARGMTFATLSVGGRSSLGIRTPQGILDVATAEQAFKEKAPTTIDAVLKGQGDISGLQRLAAKAQASPDAAKYFIAEAKAKFGPAVTHPEKIICVGLNYRKHAAETGQPVPKMPILFNKFNTTLNSPGGTIAVSKIEANDFDYESELVIVIGRAGRNIAEADAMSHIFGYCAGHDFTARDLQRRSSQWMLGKSCDGFAPIGPWLVTADLADGNKLKIETRVNGEVRQSSNTSDMVFNCQQLVSYASKYFTLAPGDIIFTGTPEGVISGYPKEKQVWLKPGDKLITTIEKLGDLSFTLT